MKGIFCCWIGIAGVDVHSQVSIETGYVNIGVCVCVHDPVHPCTHTVTQAHVSLLVLL